MEVSKTVLNLLIKLCGIRKKLRWQIRCNYVDAQGRAHFNILLYELNTNTLMGEIAFHQHSQKVLNFRYAGYYGEKPDHLVDLLLDLINHEKLSRVAQ